MKHQEMELYKVYINHDPLKGKTCSKLANGLNFYDLKKKLTPGIALTLPWSYIHVYYHCSKTSLLVYIRAQVSTYRTIGPLVYTCDRKDILKINWKIMQCYYCALFRMLLLWDTASDSNNFDTNLFRKDWAFTTYKQHFRF